ncbi:hypothetical protein J2S09_001289 [Bacillus fengqiuensis]|nr:hypothetical protein [Bacillus fengqiuensis]
MSYMMQATQQTPAYIIYLIDVSASMNVMMGERKRIEIVESALNKAIRQMVFRSTKGSRVSPRYRISIFAYSDQVYDVLEGTKAIDELARNSDIKLRTERLTDTARAFSIVERKLREELPYMQDGPAPLVCHMTDGEYTGDDPEPIVQRIRNLSVQDGNVLVENIFISDDILAVPIANAKGWAGIMPEETLKGEYANKLKRMTSTIPESYREMMSDEGYSIQQGALMMLPGTSPDLVSLGFQMSSATPIR